MSDNYVESGYVEDGYIVGDAIVYDSSLGEVKKVNFIVDNQGYDEENLHKLLLDKVGANYEDDVNIIFGESLKIGEKISDAFSFKNIVGGITQEQLTEINTSIPTMSDIKNYLLSDASFLTSLMSKLSVSIVALNGTEITSSLIYDEDENKYTLDYDTSLLDDTDYTIELELV